MITIRHDVTVPTYRPGPDAKLRRATFRQRERLEDPRELPFRRVIGWCLIPVNHKRRLNSRSVTGVPISSARYRIGPTSASARWRWASILAFSICRLASACASRWRSANDIGALAAFLVSDRHRTERAALPRRFPDGRVNLGDAPIEVGDGLALDGEASLGVGGSVRKRRIDSCHMIEVGAREEAEHADRPS